MATYTYADWISQTTVALRLSRLRLHIQEVSQKININVGADGKYRGSFDVMSYYKSLLDKEKEIEARSERLSYGISRVRVRDVRGSPSDDDC